LAIKLSEAFGNTVEFWLNLQNDCELWYAGQKVDRNRIKHFYKATA
jgi:plasmid maintenance system antidote protein VapI